MQGESVRYGVYTEHQQGGEECRVCIASEKAVDTWRTPSLCEICVHALEFLPRHVISFFYFFEFYPISYGVELHFVRFIFFFGLDTGRAPPASGLYHL